MYVCIYIYIYISGPGPAPEDARLSHLAGRGL